MQSIACSVCCYPCDGLMRCGVVACQACKSFFIRVKRTGYTKLICSRGTNDCKLEPSYSINGADGRQIRQICPKCRFEKFVNLQRINKFKNFKTKEMENKQLALVEFNDPGPFPIEIITEIKERFGNLMNFIPLLPGRARPIENPSEIATCFLGNYRIMCQAISQYGRSLNGYSNTNITDRCRIFMKICLRLCLVIFSVVNDLTPMGFTPDNFKLVPVGLQGTQLGVTLI